MYGPLHHQKILRPRGRASRSHPEIPLFTNRREIFDICGGLKRFGAGNQGARGNARVNKQPFDFVCPTKMPEGRGDMPICFPILRRPPPQPLNGDRSGYFSSSPGASEWQGQSDRGTERQYLLKNRAGNWREDAAPNRGLRASCA